MTDALINYGTTVTRAGSAIGHCIVVQWPEAKTEKVDVTAHDSSNVGEYISTTVVYGEDMTLSLIPASGVITTLTGDLVSGTPKAYVLTDDQGSMTFSGFVTSVKKEQADAQSPDAVKYTVILAVTGAITFA